MIELGFDNIHKHREEYWLPIFTGYIMEKEEDADSQSVSLQLFDEWVKLLGLQLSPVVKADELIDYDPDVDDNRLIQLGTYFGCHDFLKAEYQSKSNQLTIPCAVNVAGNALAHTGYTAPQFTLFTPCLTFPDLLADYITDDNAISENVKLYFWGWSQSTKQWLQLPKYEDDTTENWKIVNGKVIFLKDIDEAVTFKTVAGSDVLMTLEQYFNVSSKDYDGIVHISLSNSEYNPVKILYKLLVKSGISTDDIDASNTDPDLWSNCDLDFNDQNYYSFDNSSYYLDRQQVKLCVNANKQSTLLDLINAICSLTRGGFFIDKGRDKVPYGFAKRRIRFVIHQPRLVTTNIKTLSHERIRDCSLSRSRDDVRNVVRAYSFNYSTESAKIDDNRVLENSSESSIECYGEMVEDISYTSKSICFLYNCSYYANFLTQHYLFTNQEPPPRLSFKTDLIGFNFDLKSLIGIREPNLSLDVDLDSKIINGVFEIYSMNFNTNNYMISFEAQWAGYLLFPDGDIVKRWAFCENAYCDEDENGVEYHIW
ncbi:MAG: hypothetical protein ABIL22_04230 [candidate division WOR-3 bacterium]